jgi:hypothetical protein
LLSSSLSSSLPSLPLSLPLLPSSLPSLPLSLFPMESFSNWVVSPSSKRARRVGSSSEERPHPPTKSCHLMKRSHRRHRHHRSPVASSTSLWTPPSPLRSAYLHLFSLKAIIISVDSSAEWTRVWNTKTIANIYGVASVHSKRRA